MKPKRDKELDKEIEGQMDREFEKAGIKTRVYPFRGIPEMTEEKTFTGTWRDGVKTLAPDSATLIMRGKLRIKTRPSDKEALELTERYKDKTFGEVKKILDDAQFWLQFMQILSFEEKKETPKRLEVRRTINKVGHIFFKKVYNANKELGNIAGEFMALNEEYVLSHSGEEETNGTVDILQAGFTTNQLKFLERLCVMLEKEKGTKE